MAFSPWISSSKPSEFWAAYPLKSESADVGKWWPCEGVDTLWGDQLSSSPTLAKWYPQAVLKLRAFGFQALLNTWSFSVCTLKSRRRWMVPPRGSESQEFLPGVIFRLHVSYSPPWCICVVLNRSWKSFSSLPNASSVILRSVSTYYFYHSWVMWAGVLFLSYGWGIQLPECKCLVHHTVYDVCNTVSNLNLDYLTPSSVVLKQLSTTQTAFSWPSCFLLIHDLNNTAFQKMCSMPH